MKKYLTLIASLLFIGIAAFGREGVCVEYRITSGSVSGTNKTFSSEGDSRSEMTMQSAAMANGMSSVTLILHSEPGKVFMLNEQDKTYSEIDATKSAAGHRDDDDYEVTVLGKEKVNEYNCVHVRMLNKRSQHSSEMWLSKDVKGYAAYMNVKTRYFGGSKFFTALKDKGAEGFVVRVVSTSDRGGGTMQMDLVKAEKQTVSESMFSLGGYAKGASPYPSHQQGAPGVINTEDLQKMTPEERKVYIEKMKEQYQQH